MFFFLYFHSIFNFYHLPEWRKIFSEVRFVFSLLWSNVSLSFTVVLILIPLQLVIRFTILLLLMFLSFFHLFQRTVFIFVSVSVSVSVFIFYFLLFLVFILIFTLVLVSKKCRGISFSKDGSSLFLYSAVKIASRSLVRFRREWKQD